MNLSDFSLVKTDSELLAVNIEAKPMIPFTFSVHNKDYDIEDLTLLVNPSELTFSNSYVKKDTLVRGFYIVNMWGSSPMGIQASVNSGMFMTEKHGLTSMFRDQSKAYRYLMRLLAIYKLNALTYSSHQLPKTDFYKGYFNLSTVIDRIGLVGIHYHTIFGDRKIYGSFDTFEYSEGESPFDINFSFGFTGFTTDLSSVKGHVDFRRGV